MPILNAETDLWPTDLLDSAPASNGQTWHVAHTRARQEKALVRWLLEWKISFYIPLMQRRGGAESRDRSSYIPVFTGYVFFAGDAEARLLALQSKRVAHVLPVFDQHQLLEDLRGIRRLTCAGLPVQREEVFQPGRPVRIAHGPLKGQSGIIIRRSGRYRLVVAVDFVRQGVSVEIDADAVERC